VSEVERTHIGGQAVLEGVMMRGKFNWAVAVRESGGHIHVEEHDLPHSAAREHAWLRWPVIRGVWGFYETIRLALQAFAISAEHAAVGDGGEEGEAPATLSSAEVAFTLVLGLALAVGLFIVLPAVATNLLGRTIRDNLLLWNLVNGVLRLGVFFAYLWAVGRVKDVQRVFAYHGAEHEIIHTYEHGDPLDAEHAHRYGTLHVRCGTSFLLMVMIVAMLVYMLVPIKPLVPRILSHILLLPVVAGLAYEITVKWAGTHEGNPLVKVLLWPGMQLQRMTTRPPDDSMIEVAVAAVTPVIERELAEARTAEAAPEAPGEDLT
jgi:uncharacterized protein YqhQ